jgi:hypothetical protein
MNRLILILVAFALVVAACSGAADETSDSGAVNETAASNSTSSSATGESSTDSTAPTAAADASNESSTEARAVPDGPPAKDFTLALEPSGEFVLSQEVKPVYMIFWAEW